jgi:UDP-N-acetylglucosamine acyltransferase
MSIHPTAIISGKVTIDPTTEIGPYVIIDGEVEIGPNCTISPHVVILGHTTIGSNNVIHTGAVIGDKPQDLAYKSSRSYVRIGNNNIIREYVTIHRGTDPESETVIGNECFLMAFAHVAHNCRVSDHVKLVNNVLLAGHVHVGESTIISGGAGAHQFVRIGKYCMIAGHSLALMDVPHYMIVQGDSDVVSYNRVGLKRAGFTSEEINEVRMAYRTLYRGGTSFIKAIQELEKNVKSPKIQELIDFLKAPSKRGISGPPRVKKESLKEDDADE